MFGSYDLGAESRKVLDFGSRGVGIRSQKLEVGSWELVIMGWEPVSKEPKSQNLGVKEGAESHKL